MSQSKKVFITSSVFFAFIDRAHRKHEEGTAYFRFFAENGYYLYTNTGSLEDSYKQIYTEISPSLSKDFLRIAYLSDLNILYADESDTKAALKTLVTYRSTELTFQQALVAVLSYRRGIGNICTFDYFHPLFGIEAFFLPM